MGRTSLTSLFFSMITMTTQKSLFLNLNQQDIRGVKLSDYKEGFQDGYKFAREELMEKLREIDIRDIDSWLLNQLADMIEGNDL